MFLFCIAKAKTASRGREIFPSGKILVTTSVTTSEYHVDNKVGDFDIINLEVISKLINLMIHKIAFILLIIGAWRRHRRSARLCAIAAVAVILIQGRFIWVRDAYGALSIPVLVFDILEIAVAILYLVFFFSSQRERYLSRTNAA